MTEVALTIPSDLQGFLEEAVRGGPFRDAGDFLVTLLYDEKARKETGPGETDSEKWNALRAEIGIGIAQAERGEFAEFTAADILEEGRARRSGR